MRSNTFLIYGHSGWNGKEAAIRKANENWRLAAIHVPGTVLTSSSCFFVALIVFLRILVVKQPLTYDDAHEKIGRIGSIAIWSFALLVNLCPLIVSLPPIFDISKYGIAYVWTIRVSLSLPILLTLIMYGMLLYTLKQAKGVADLTNMAKRSVAKMIHGVVVSVVICNVPYVAWLEHLCSLQFSSEVFNTNSGVHIIKHFVNSTKHF